jgi:hypothetical protein
MLPQITPTIDSFGSLVLEKFRLEFEVNGMTGYLSFDIVKTEEDTFKAIMDVFNKPGSWDLSYDIFDNFVYLPELVTVLSISHSWDVVHDVAYTIKEVVRGLLKSYFINYKREYAVDTLISCDELTFIENAILHELMRKGVNLEQRMNDGN